MTDDSIVEVYMMADDGSWYCWDYVGINNV
jgi:hypothetical protein